MADDQRPTCGQCGRQLDLVTPRTTDGKGKILSCGLCPKVRWELNTNDKRFLRSLRIAVDK